MWFIATEVNKQIGLIKDQLEDQLDVNRNVIVHIQAQLKINDLLFAQVKALKQEVQILLRARRESKNRPFNIPEGASCVYDGKTGGYRVVDNLEDLEPGEEVGKSDLDKVPSNVDKVSPKKP